MKRPEGFEPITRRQASPPPVSKKVQKAQQASVTQKAPKAPVATPAPSPRTRAAASVIRVKSPETRETPRIKRADREARIELRRAARERRRYERSEVRRFTKRARNRRIGALTAVGLFALLGAMLLVAVYSPLLSLQKVTVEGTSRVDVVEVTAVVDDQLGTPLALIDFDEITDGLGELPLIRSYVTETVPPDTLVIRVTERTPIAVMETGSTWSLVDPAGVVIQSVKEKPKGMPIVSAGVPGERPFIAAAEVLLSLPENIAKRVATISASTEDDVSFTLTKTNQTVVWGSSSRSESKASTLGALMKSQKENPEVGFNVSSPGIALVIDEDEPVAP